MALEDDVRILSRNPTLAALEPDALRHLAGAAQSQILRKGEVLFRRDDPSDGGYVVVSGSLILELADRGPVERVIYPPMLLGDMALITKTHRPATAIARERTVVLKISRVLFLSILEDSPRSAERLKRLLTDQLEQFVRELDGTSASKPDER
jgi:CRP-like cAMP-binding protein